jgi:hypothetical protein
MKTTVDRISGDWIQDARSELELEVIIADY